MRKIASLLIFCMIIISCEKDSLESMPEKQTTFDNQDIIGPENKASSGRTFTDATGTIEIYIGSTQVFHNGNPNLVSGNAYVPNGFVCIGGGARINIPYAYPPYSSDPGSLLTMSAPLNNGLFNGWQAEAKAHSRPNGNPWSLLVDVVGMRLKDNNGNYIPAQDLKNSLRLFSRTSARAGHPSTSVAVSNGYQLIGGGAKVNWSGYGNLLTESYPLGNSWKVKSKDHLVVSPATITAYAIGIKNTIPNFGSFKIDQVADCKTPNYYASIYSRDAFFERSEGYLTTCAGGKTTYNGNGRMLVGLSSFQRDGSFVESKDHLSTDTGTICAYAVGIKKIL
ncbi:hypothetical protein [Aquimarina aggregata]|nr:hypothetical protein [Aquimarina aggregata]